MFYNAPHIHNKVVVDKIYLILTKHVIK